MSILLSKSFFLRTINQVVRSQEFSSASFLPFTFRDRPSSVSCPHYENKPTPFPVSFWYVKSFKTGSSTLAGVFRSIGAHHGISVLKAPSAVMIFPEVRDGLAKHYEWSEHAGLANHIAFSGKVAALFKRPFLLFASVREPVSQFHSRYVEDCLLRATALRKNNSNCFLSSSTAQRMITARTMQYNPQVNYIRGDMSENNSSMEAVADQYDFIFVKERMDESLVAFAIIYNLDFADVVSIPSKVREGKYQKADDMPDEINEIVRSKTGKDLELWQHANALLDKRVAEIKTHCGDGGATYFETVLTTFRTIKAIVAEECRTYREWYEVHGFKTLFAYWNDNGQGPRCRDHVVRRVVQEYGGRG